MDSDHNGMLEACPCHDVIVWNPYTTIYWEMHPESGWTWHQYSDKIYRKISNISRTLVGNKTVDYSDVVGGSPVDAAPSTSSFST